MESVSLLNILSNPFLINALFALAGSVITGIILYLRGRIKKLEYSVTHDRVALSSDDAIFGSIRVTWRNANVVNLFYSRVTLENLTDKDYQNLQIRVYTGKTLLLSERTEISGTTHILDWSPAFRDKLHVPEGDVPTLEQFDIYNHRREYTIPVLNRGQRILMTYLTSVPTGDEDPSVWLDLLHPGVQLEFRYGAPSVHGVPVMAAVYTGLVVCLIVWATASLIQNYWIAGFICLAVGLFARSVGAFTFRGLKFVKTLIIR